MGCINKTKLSVVLHEVSRETPGVLLLLSLPFMTMRRVCIFVLKALLVQLSVLLGLNRAE